MTHATSIAMTNSGAIIDILEKCRKATCNGIAVYSIYDAICIARGFRAAHAHTCYMRILKNHPRLTASATIKFPGQGQRPTPVASETMCADIVRLVVGSSRLPLDNRRAIVGDTQYIPVRTYIEEEIHGVIEKAFSHEDILRQYNVGRFRVDMYFPVHNLAIECDEDGHKGYEEGADLSRQEYITSELKCSWIRYNPYDADFNIFRLINSIVTALSGETKLRHDLAMEAEKTRQIEAAEKTCQEKEKTRQMELELEILRLKMSISM